MRLLTPALGAVMLASFGLGFVSAQQPPPAPAPAPETAAPAAAGQQPAGRGRGRVGGGGNLMVLSPKGTPAGWTGVHKPHTKLADVLAKHKGQVDWAETIVDDESLFAQWISMGPGQ